MTESQDPIFVIGRQHSGNTMQTAVLGRHPAVYAFLNEDQFFEHVDRFSSPPSDRDLDRLTQILADAYLPALAPAQRRDIRQSLQQEADRSSPQVTASALYRKMKDRRAARQGAKRWAQKATSYVFHVETLLKKLPDAKLVFLLRNPLDIAASLRIRQSEAYWLRMCLGWRKGVDRARWLEDVYPKNILVIRYEDLVRKPKDRVADILRFCGLGFHERALQVHKVNPAEAPYQTSREQSGISDEKVGYHRDHLTRKESATIVRFAGHEAIRSEYPNLESAIGADTSSSLATILRLTALGVSHMVADVVRRGMDNPVGTLHRFWHRFKG